MCTGDCPSSSLKIILVVDGGVIIQRPHRTSRHWYATMTQASFDRLQRLAGKCIHSGNLYIYRPEATR